jgi:2'-5' RNA ligase
VRLFIALYPDDAAVEDLQARIERLRVGRAREEGINTRIASAQTWHITLAFLGEVADDRVDTAAHALAAGVALWRPTADPTLTLAISGGGTFGRGRFTMLWVGLADPADPVRALASAIRLRLSRAKLPYDHKPFRPHLTLARVGDRIPAAAVNEDVSALHHYRGPRWRPSHVHLMRSELGPAPVYTPIHSESLW